VQPTPLTLTTTTMLHTRDATNATMVVVPHPPVCPDDRRLWPAAAVTAVGAAAGGGVLALTPE